MTTTATPPSKQTQTVPQRVIGADGVPLDVFSLPSDQESLEALLRDLFTNHWYEITFGPIIEGAAWEIHAPGPPTKISLLDGYLTIAFGLTHFHICIGETKGPQRANLRRACAAPAHTSRGTLPPDREELRAPILEYPAFQRCGRAADNDPSAQSFSRSWNGKDHWAAGLVTPCIVGSPAGALAWPHRTRSDRPPDHRRHMTAECILPLSTGFHGSG
ncbi:DUF7676 family protein [Beijerinckia indica]|uniref:Uncharacterized protein n=1 Tax=Beijerinckia indica subsp. indica (strain ATCC 9039 / DSM 1715 / NCIMB 8712) TaxID=395963 RepID=B2IFX5_BEII9|nr:hypothetical protein [Beijerinckia indica]ACB95714.1 hypothetical protein Bind_2093 [Beijerinckia indica subsp. indica ATCC 9039]